MDLNRFYKLISTLRDVSDENIFRLHGITSFPRVTLCGLGDPLLHPRISELVRLASEAQFYTQLVTNGALLTDRLADELGKNGLREICFSLHSMNPENYKAITGIDLNPTLFAISSAIPILQKHQVNIAFWRILHPNSMYHDGIGDEKHYHDFLEENGIPSAQMLGPSEPWSRNGTVPNSKCPAVQDAPFWCNKIVFTFNIDWEGNIVLCCNGFCNENDSLGNVFDPDFSFRSYFRKKLKVLNKQILPEMCRNCKRWPDLEISSILQENGINEELFINNILKIIEKGDSCDGKN